MLPKGWEIGNDIEAADFTVRNTENKRRLYRVRERVCWEGYIHEELYDLISGDARVGKSSLVLNHLSGFRQENAQSEKSQMYSWMLLRLYEEKQFQKGVSPFWYEQYVPKNLERLRFDAEGFDPSGEINKIMRARVSDKHDSNGRVVSQEELSEISMYGFRL